MRRGVALYFVGSALLLTLAGCGGGWMSFEQREPWRREAEAACVRSGAVKQSAAAVQITSISGPGVCGADYPFKVAALGDRTILGYLSEPRPPGSIPGRFPIPEPRQTSPARYPQPSAYPPQQPTNSGPISLHPPGVEPAEEEDSETTEAHDGPDDAPANTRLGPGREPYAVTSRPYPPPRGHAAPSPYPNQAAEQPPPLGPNRGLAFAGGPASVVPAATLACPLVSKLDHWMAQAVQPAAQRWFGQQVVEIKQISAYSCRGMNGSRTGPISEHAFGNALDIAAFTLADGRRVTVKDGWRGAPEEKGFLRDVHAAACEHFSTVLAPGSNRFHYDHIHVDLARRRSGRTYCNPRPVPGDLIARRASDRTITGSVRGGRPLSYASEEQGARRTGSRLPHAEPGND